MKRTLNNFWHSQLFYKCHIFDTLGQPWVTPQYFLKYIRGVTPDVKNYHKKKELTI